MNTLHLVGQSVELKILDRAISAVIVGVESTGLWIHKGIVLERIIVHFGLRSTEMIINMTTKEINGVPVVSLNGRIVLGQESSSLRERAKTLLTEGKKKIVLNMTNVTYIDSAGLGMLVAAHVSAKHEGAAMHLSNLGTKFRRIAVDQAVDCFQRLRHRG